MSSVPIALWNLKVPSGGIKVPGYDDEDGSPLPYRITMAAIDSSIPSSKPSTLKLYKRVVTAVSSTDEDEDEDEYMKDDDSTEEEFVICTLESGKVSILQSLLLTLDVSTNFGYHYARG
jgi:Nucleoplasmin-like domain